MSSGEKGWCVLNLHASTLAALAPEIIEYNMCFPHYKPIGREIWQFGWKTPKMDGFIMENL